jgi:hypothetical protein
MSDEKEIGAANGFLFLLLFFVAIGGVAFLVTYLDHPWPISIGVVLIFLLPGLTVVNPNQSPAPLDLQSCGT